MPPSIARPLSEWGHRRKSVNAPTPRQFPSPTPRALCPRALWGCGKHPSALARRPPRGIYRAETPRRGEPKFSISAPLPLCARFGSHSHFSPGLQNGPPSPKPVNSFPHAHRTKSVTPPLRGNSPPLRQRRYAIQPGVIPGMRTDCPSTPRALCHKARGCAAEALPRVQATSRSLPRKGLCRSCPLGGAGNKGGMGSCSRVRKRSPPGMYVHYPRHTHTSHATRSNQRHNPVGVVYVFGLYPG